ncbi:MAG: TRAP transporter permease [Peptococcaceae bacterium]|jgi:TRAP transporter 4TM/12TM fusion protein|nr:TRAP transporter permease [Peptococcaceae bacterium]MDH7525616.1 TRAP transporter permease [Peptococcaceae bacterium]
MAQKLVEQSPGEMTNHEMIDQETSAKILAKYDREFAYRRLKGPVATFCFILAVLWALAQLYTAAFGVFPSTLQRAPHVGAALMLIFLLYPAKRGSTSNKIPFYDYILALLGFAVSAYHVVFYEELVWRAGVYTQLDAAVGVIAVLLVLEATRRIAGPVIVTLAVFFLLYAYFGSYFPSFMAHKGLSIKRIAVFQWISTEGILGIPIAVSSTFIFLFMLFATFLKKTGIGDWLTSIAVGVTGGAVGGPAKAAVVASAAQGTVSGSSVANTVGTGSVTIPLMKSIGYRPEFAGAVEAAASTGGQLMPPIMGAAAFVMSEFLNIPYGQIALAAAIPAVLYFTGIFITVHLEAVKTGLTGIAREKLPDWKRELKRKWFLSTPIIGIVWLLIKGYTPMIAAFIGVLLCIGASMILKETRISLWNIIKALEEGARSALPVVAACATAGIIVGVITLTGLGLKMGGGLLSLAGGSIHLTMFLTMIASLILGMGVPTTANYIIQATVSAPALVKLGAAPIAAHLFVFYFGIVADITPPVALAAFAGSGIAQSNPLKTGVEASKLGAAAYLVPYIFVLSPVLVLVRPEGATTLVFLLLILKALATALIGMLGIGGATTGYFVTNGRWYERLLLFIGGVSLIDPGAHTDIAGLILLAVVWLLQKRRTGKHKPGLAK